MPPCPKCGKGKLIKGKSAYGCSAWKSGCDFRFSFADIKAKAAGRKLTRSAVLEIIGG
jgi:DNA topoisomerase-3